MSSTILHELMDVRRTLTARYGTTEPSNSESYFDTQVLNFERVHMLQEAGIQDGQHYDAVRVLKGSLPYRRYCEESERENEAQMAAGGREICPDCGQRSVVSQDVCTLGYPGHPGAEFSVYRQCENCDYKEL